MLSVLVPVYNVEKYIRRCVESILKQSYDDLEVILVDDGSTDESGVICDEYTRQDKRVKVIHKKNGGLNTARIAGLEAATRRYVTFVDSDDYIEENMYGELIQKIQHAHADIVVGGYVSELEDGTVSCPFSLGDEAVYSPEDALCTMFEAKHFNWSLWDKIYRRSLFERLDDINKWPASYGEDTYMNHKLFLLADSVAYVPLYAYHYCTRNESMMQRDFHSDRLAYLDIYHEIIQTSVERNRKYTKIVARLMLHMAHSCFVKMHKKWEFYANKISTYRNLVSSDLRVAQFKMNSLEKLKYNVIMVGFDDYRNRINERNQALLGLAALNPNIVVYGTGPIAREIAEALDFLSVEIHSFCVTQLGKEKSFCGKRVCQVDEISFSPDDVTFILAMRKENEREVSAMLQQKGYNNVFCMGKYSLAYMEPDSCACDI